MTIQELIDQFEIQGAYCIKKWIEEDDDYDVLAQGEVFECEYYDINEEYMNTKIDYMYAVDGVLNIELEM